MLCVIYRPPNTSLQEFTNDFSQYLDELECVINKNTHLLLAGDYNIDLLNYSDVTINNFLNTLYAHSIFPSIVYPTRITEHSATLIDNIYINKTHAYSTILYSDISDHLPIITFLEHSFQAITPTKTISKIHFPQLKHDLSQIKWPNFNMHNDVNYAYEYFLQTIQETVNKHTTHVTITNTRLKHQWMTTGIVKSCHVKNNMYKKYLHGLLPKQEYTCYKNKLTEIIKRRKCEYYNNFLNNHKNNARAVWQHLNLILGRCKQANNNLSSLNINILNTFFAELGINTTKHIKHTDNFTRYLQHSYINSFFLSPVTPQEICDISKSLKNKNSVGFDNLSISTVKQIITYIASPISDICNLSFLNGVVPDKLKIAKVCPIHKSGPKDNPVNYRPISILPAFSKIVEKAVITRLMKYIKSNP